MTTTTTRLQENLADARFERKLAAEAMSAAKASGNARAFESAAASILEADRNVASAKRMLDFYADCR